MTTLGLLTDAGVNTGASWPDYAAVAIAAFSLLVATFFGVRNSRTARRALKLSERQESRREPRLDLYLNDSMAWRTPADGSRLFGFHMQIANPTDRRTTITESDLLVTYSRDDVMMTVKVPHTRENEYSRPEGSVTALDLPLVLNANSAVMGWLLFRIPDDLTGGNPIERYDVTVRDLHDIVESRQVTVLHEAS